MIKSYSSGESKWRWIRSILVITTAVSAHTSNIEEVPTTVRLVGGATSSEGRLEVLYNDTWGTVCDDYFSRRDGVVVCRQLGFIGVVSIPSIYRAGEGPIWLDNVQCTGSENSIFNCPHGGVGVHNCDHTEDVGIICDPCPFNDDNVEDGAVRLAGGDCHSNGRVEIFHDGEWGTVCESGWDLDDATVVCRQLGFQRALRAPPGSYYGAGVGRIWLSNVQCSGSESRLKDCNHDGWGVVPVLWCDHRINDASVECEGDISTPSPTTPLQIGASVHTTTKVAISPSHTVSSSSFPSSQLSPTTIHTSLHLYHTPSLSSQVLPTSSSYPVLPTPGVTSFSEMELMIGLIALGFLLIGSVVSLLMIIVLVCVCRNRRTKSVRVEDCQLSFPPTAGLQVKSEVVLTNTNVLMSHA